MMKDFIGKVVSYFIIVMNWSGVWLRSFEMNN